MPAHDGTGGMIDTAFRGSLDLQIIETPRGSTIAQGDAVLSEVLASPGPTNGFFDIIAASVAALHGGGTFVMLGFAGGGIVAPLRAMGFSDSVVSVDMSLEGKHVFTRHSDSWAGDVIVHEAEAGAWLSSAKTRSFDLILEDLSVAEPGGVTVTKPPISTTTLPQLISERLAPGGIAIFNLLASPEMTWKQQLETVTRPFPSSLLIRDEEYENRLVVSSGSLPAAGILARAIRRLLKQIGSDRAGDVRVRSLRRQYPADREGLS